MTTSIWNVVRLPFPRRNVKMSPSFIGIVSMSICNGGNFENIPPPIPIGMNASRYIQQQTNANFFIAVQNSNIFVSTLRSQLPEQAASYSYYVFLSYAEINSFNNGRMILIQAYPNSNWAVVQQN